MEQLEQLEELVLLGLPEQLEQLDEPDILDGLGELVLQEKLALLDILGKQDELEQVDKLVEVVRVVDLCEGDHVERELLLIKVRAEGAARAEIKRSADIFRGQIVDVTAQTYTIQLVGPSDKLDAFVRAIDDSGVNATILEVVRSGVSGLGRGDQVLAL